MDRGSLELPSGPVAGPGEAEDIRLFVATLLPAAVLDELQAVQKQLQKRLRAVAMRWTRPDQLHLTLQFLGAVPASSQPDLVQRLSLAARAAKPVELRLGALGAFPDPRRPRILWVGIEGQISGLSDLQAATAASFREVGEAREERGFHPHLTIGRIPPEAKAGRLIEEALAAMPSARSVPWTVREIQLLRSELRPEGARHTIVAAADLGISRPT